LIGLLSKIMRKKLIAGNWKMNGTFGENKRLLDPVLECIRRYVSTPNCRVVVCVPFPYFVQVQNYQDMSRDNDDEPMLFMGAQDVSEHEVGAYTGEVSARMLREHCVSYVIVGHSERRAYHAESDALVAAKAKVAIANDLIPIVCIGETLTEREAGQTQAVVSRQLAAVLQALGADAVKIVVAYEPVWAIGTGKVATPEQAQAVHAAIRAQLRAALGAAAENMQLLYGGSMKPDNAAQLLQQPDIDGGLIGGAALKATDFLAIFEAAQH
jgi:triosephosphate isomerase (TIM)